MKIIDADDYLIEIDSAWDYMLESAKAFKTEMNSAIHGTLYPQFEVLAVANCLWLLPT